MAESTRKSSTGASDQDFHQKKWAKPILRKLPITATSGAGTLNEGVGKGKGQSGPTQVS